MRNAPAILAIGSTLAGCGQFRLGGGGDEVSTTGDAPLVCEEEGQAPPPRQLRLLTRREYNATVRSLLPFLDGGSTGATCSTDASCDISAESCVGGTCQADPCELVTFVFPASGGQYGGVTVAGSFNSWDAGAWPMEWVPEHSAWVTKRVLSDGEHTYKFVADGNWITDPSNPATADDGFGGQNSLWLQACDGAAPSESFEGGNWAGAFPVESRPSGYPFDNAAESAIVTSVHAEQYDRAAQTLAGSVRSHVNELAGCTSGDACTATFVADFGLRAFRRPLTTDERVRYEALAKAQPDFGTGIEAVAQAMLQSPYFLYRFEVGEVRSDGTFGLDDYEVASALSYMLVGTMPDDELLDAAGNGELGSADGREAHARRLLDDPRAREHLATFAEQWLDIEDVPSMTRSSELYPGFTSSVGQGMVDETLDFVTWVAFDGPGRFEDLLLTPGDDAERVGLLGQKSVLTATSHSDQSSPIRRGLLVRERLLCQTFPTPPANVGPVPEIDPDATTRDRFAQHTQDPFCAGCHDLIDPVGFGLEEFDAVGEYRSEENGFPIDASGDVIGLEDMYDGASNPFQGLTGLAQVLADSTAARRCYTTQTWRFATGRLDEASDQCAIDALDDAFARSGGDLRELLVELVRSPDYARRSP